MINFFLSADLKEIIYKPMNTKLQYVYLNVMKKKKKEKKLLYNNENNYIY